jgi:hypothetical protein
MRTQEEIVARVIEKRDEFLNFEPEVLIPFLKYEYAKRFLKDEVTVDDWDPDLLTKEIILSQAKTYMAEYGWDKAENHRGISAGRTVQKMEVWMWLLGNDKMVAVCQDDSMYPQYGAPILKAICKEYNWPIPNNEEVQRMSRGEPCGADYDCGCGC